MHYADLLVFIFVEKFKNLLIVLILIHLIVIKKIGHFISKNSCCFCN